MCTCVSFPAGRHTDGTSAGWAELPWWLQCQRGLLNLNLPPPQYFYYQCIQCPRLTCGSFFFFFFMWGSVKVQVEFCRGYQTRLLLTMKKTWWKESYLPGTEMLTEREKCRTQRLRPAIATGSNKLEHLHGSGKSHTFVTFLQWQIWFPQAASHDPWLFSLLQIISCENLTNLL